jgi:branched-chain amino acid transport system substrate-binding protein
MEIFRFPRRAALIQGAVAAAGDIVQDVHIRKVERQDGQLWNIEIDKTKAVKDGA